MAFVADNTPNQDPNQQGNNPLAQQAPITSAPNAGGAGKATPSNSAPTQPFTNLNSYLSANAPQIQQEGQQIAGNLTNQYGQTQADITSAQNQFGGQVQSGYTPNNQATIDQFNASPTAVANDPTAAASFQGMYNDQYTGPANFETTPLYSNLTGEVQNATTAASNLQTPAGVEAYFSSNNPNYTQGMGILDSSLLQANPDVQANITAAAAPMANLPGYLTSAVNTSDAAVQNAVQQAAAAKAAAQGAFGTESTNFANTVNQEYDTAAQGAIDYNKMINDITGKVNNNDFTDLTPQEQQMIGYNPAFADLVSGYSQIFPTQAQNNPINWSSYFTNGAQEAIPTPNQVVTPDQAATYQALAALSGGQGMPLVNFDMPTPDALAAPNATPAAPAYNFTGAADQIGQNYGSMYDQLLTNGFTGIPSTEQQSIVNYMNGVLNAENGWQNPTNNPTGLPTTPPPPPGSPGDLGNGFHWNPTTGTWDPTIPLQPPVPVQPPSGGSGGRHFF